MSNGSLNNNRLKKSLFVEELSDCIEHAATLSGKLILIGDFNVHWDCEEDSERMKLATLLNDYDLVQHVKGLTHERGHTLDLVITRQEDDLVASCDIGAFISDHNSLHVTLNCSKTHPPRKTITYRSVSSVNVSLVGNDISSLLSHFLNNLDEAVELYNKVLLDVMDIHAPLKQCTVVDHPQHPWINESILTVKRKRKAEKKWKSSGSEISKKEYKVLCNQVKDMVKKAKDKFYAQKVHGCEGDQKKLCKIIDSFMGRGKPNILPTASSNLLLAKNLNNFFISKIDTLREVLMSLEPTAAKMSIPDLDSILKTCTAPMDTMTSASVEEVTKIIKESSKATCMLDPIPTALVKEIVTHLALYITNIVNMTLLTGIFPSKLKSAIVLPMLKKQNQDSESFKNYRLVSNLPFLSKVIEKVMACRLLEHMKENHLLDTLQSAYKKAHSTEAALLRVQNDILTSIDQKKRHISNSS